MQVDDAANPGAAGGLSAGGAIDAKAITLRVFKRQVRLLPLVGLIYFAVSGGPYGLETSISTAGPGMAMVLILVIPVLFSIPSALMAAELGSAIPLEGGYYYWVKLALGPFLGYLEGMSSWLDSFLDTALYPVLFVDYLATWFPEIRRGHDALFKAFGGNVSIDPHWLLALAFMVPLAWMNARGSRLVGDTTLTLMVILLAPFVILTGIGLYHLATTPGLHPLTPFLLPRTGAFSAFGAGLGIVIWNYIGFDDMSTALDEVDEPQRTYPRALALSIPIIVLSYVLPLLASLGSGLHRHDPGAWVDGDFANVGGILGGQWLKIWIIVGAVFSQIGLFSSELLSGSRVPAVLAADGYLPKSLAATSPRFGTPVRAIVVSCAIFAIFCSLNFQTLIDSDVMLNMFGLMFEFVALLVLRKRFPSMRRPFKVPGGWLGPILIFVSPLLLAIWLVQATIAQEIGAFYIGVVLIAIAGLSYWPAKWWIKRDQPDAFIDNETIDFGPEVDTQAVLNGRSVAPA